MANRFFEGAAHAAIYAKFRPSPPSSLIGRVMEFLKEKHNGDLTSACDVGCGSGQSTQILAPYFSSVVGFDVSQAQISEALKLNTRNNISFKVNGAEVLPFPDSSLQLVTSCQACHWFDIPQFYKEADRILVQGGVLAVYGYLFPQPIFGDATEKLCEIVNHTYKNELGRYIHQGSRDVYLDNYMSEKFRMIYKEKVEIRDDTHYVDIMASVADLTGYITTWSGFQNFHKQNGDDAASQLLQKFQNRVMSALQVSTLAEETEVCLRYRYFLLMGRKPLDKEECT